MVDAVLAVAIAFVVPQRVDAIGRLDRRHLFPRAAQTDDAGALERSYAVRCEDACGLQPIFVTVDPERDTSAVMKEPVERLGNVAERHRTRVRTMRKAKIDQEPLAAISLIGHRASVLVDESEGPANRRGGFLRGPP
jgi:hypothetical protein